MNGKNFEESIIRLNEIIQLLESGDTTLDKSIELFEEGIVLTKACNKVLNQAEQKVSILIKDENGEITETDFKG